MKAGLKAINKFKENDVQIKELMAKPAYLSVESIRECNRHIEAKIEVANMINANIATIQSKSSYLNEDQVILLAYIINAII